MASVEGGSEDRTERPTSPVIVGQFRPFKMRSNSMINYMSPRNLSSCNHPDLTDGPCLALLLEPRSPKTQIPLRRHSESPSVTTGAFQEIPLNSTPMSSELQINIENLPNRSSTASPVSRNSIASSTGFFCRICHEGEDKETLLSPCRCAGSMGLVHRSCIERWLSTKHSATCEICNFKFCVSERSPPLSNWFTHPTRPSDRRNMIGDFICFILLTPLAAVSVWLCCSGALHYVDSLQSDRWEVAGLGALSTFLMIIYCVWCFVALRYHLRVFFEWRRSNVIVRVISMPNHFAKLDEIVLDENNNNTRHHLFSSFDRSRQSSTNPLLENTRRFSAIRPMLITENINEENEDEVERMLTNEDVDPEVHEPSEICSTTL